MWKIFSKNIKNSFILRPIWFQITKEFIKEYKSLQPKIKNLKIKKIILLHPILMVIRIK